MTSTVVLNRHGLTVTEEVDAPAHPRDVVEALGRWVWEVRSGRRPAASLRGRVHPQLLERLAAAPTALRPPRLQRAHGQQASPQAIEGTLVWEDGTATAVRLACVAMATGARWLCVHLAPVDGGAAGQSRP